MQLTEIDDRTFAEEVSGRSIPVVIDFYADWCGPCRAMAPVIGSLARELEGEVHFLRINIDRSPGLAERFGVLSIPTFIRFDDGEATSVVIGAKTAPALRSALGLGPQLPGDEGTRTLRHRWRPRRAGR